MRWSGGFLVLILGAAMGFWLGVSGARAALSEEECRRLRREWLEVRLEARRLRDRIRADAQARARGRTTQAANEIADALKESREALEAADMEAVQKEVDRIRSVLGEQKNRLTEFLDGLSEGSEQAAGVLEQATTALQRIETVIRIMDANPNDPAQAAQAFADYVGLVTDVLGPLIERVPVLGDFLGFYNEALQAIAGAIGRIQENLRNQSARLLGEDIYDPRNVELSDLEGRLAELARRLARECGEHYVWFDGTFLPVAEAAARRQEAADAAAAAAAARARARAEAERRAQMRRECADLLRELEGKRSRIQSLSNQIASLSSGASTNRGTGHSNGLQQQVEPLARELEGLRREAEDLASRIRERCGNDAPDALTAAGNAEAAIAAATARARDGAGTVAVAAQATTAKAELTECQRRCRECLDELARMVAELAALEGQVPAADAAVTAAQAAVDRAAEELAASQRGAEVHVYEDSRGNLVLSATMTAPGLSYKGWIIPSDRARRIRQAREAKAAADAALAQAQAARAALDAAIAAKRAQVAAKQAECDRCRRECEESAAGFRDQYGRILGRLRDDGSVDRGATELGTLAGQIRGRIPRPRPRPPVEATPGTVTSPRVAQIDSFFDVFTRIELGDGAQATPPQAASFFDIFLSVDLRTPAQLRQAADVLAPQDGNLLVSPRGAFTVDSGALRRLAEQGGLPPPPPPPGGPLTVNGMGGDDVFEVRPGSPGSGGPLPVNGLGGDDLVTVGTGGHPGSPIRGVTPDDRTQEDLTGGPLARDFLTPQLPGGVPPPVPPGDPFRPQLDLNASGGDDVFAPVLNSDLTRVGAMKDSLRTLGQAIVGGDLPAMMGTFDPEASFDVSIFRNAALDFFNRVRDILLDFEITQANVTFEGGSLDLNFLIGGVDTQTGGVFGPRRSRSYIRFRRVGRRFLISGIQGDFPLLHPTNPDPFLRSQIQAGQPSSDSSSGSGVKTLTFTLNNPGNDHALLDLDAGTFLPVTGSGSETGQTDLIFFPFVGYSNYFFGEATAPGVFNANKVTYCGGSSLFPDGLASIRNVDTGAFFTQAFCAGSAPQYFAFETSDGRIGALEITFSTFTASVATVTIKIQLAPPGGGDTINADGTQDCGGT